MPQLRVEHALRELQHLAHGVVVVLALARGLAQVGHGRHAHEHIVQPEGVRQRAHLASALPVRAAAGQRAVLQAIFLPGDEVAADANHLAIVDRRRGQFRLHEAVAQGAGVVQRVRVEEALDRRRRASRVGLHRRVMGLGQVGQQLVALGHVVGIALVAGGGASGQHAEISHAPFVAGQAEVARLQDRLRVGARRVIDAVIDRRTGRLVDQLGRRGALEIGQHTVEHGLCLRRFHRAVLGRVFDVERMQHGVGRGWTFFLGDWRFLGRYVERQWEQAGDECTNKTAVQLQGILQNVFFILGN
jgi:hypothetical protein